MNVKFNTIPEAIEDIRVGKMILVVDDEDRENEGDLVMAAEKATPEAINFMATHARGLICTPMSGEMLDKLGMEQMVAKNTDNHETAFTVSVDHVETTTGISVFERTRTILKMIEDDARPEDFRRPGHVFPLRARQGGVLRRSGHTEATVDLAILAGLKPAGICCEIMSENGDMARTPELMKFAQKFQLKIITVADLIAYRKNCDKLVRSTGKAELPTKYGMFKVIAYESDLDSQTHLAIVKGDVQGKKDVLVRVHSECLTGDVLSSLRCDCGEQLNKALEMIEKEGLGVVIYLRQEGRGIGLGNKIKAYALQDIGMDTVEANEALGFEPDMRDYGIGAQIMADIGLTSIKLMTNNPAKRAGLDGYDIKITNTVPIEVEANEYNAKYLSCKRLKMGHVLRRT